MTTLRTVLLIAVVIAGATDSSVADVSQGGDSAELRSDPPPTPIVWSFKGGLQGALNYDRVGLSVSQTGNRFNVVGLTVEAHDLKRLVAGLGVEFSWNRWEISSSYPRSQSYYSRTASVYGTLGYSMWKSLDNRSRAWSSIDVGRIWYSEESTPFSTETISTSNLSDNLVRLRVSYLRQITGPLALGVTSGWQWAEPERQLWNSTKRVKLSGPLIAAHVSLVSPLGNSSCSD